MEYFNDFLNKDWDYDFNTHIKNDENCPLECYLHEHINKKESINVLNNLSHMLPYSALTIHCSDINYEFLCNHVKNENNNVTIKNSIPTSRTLDEYNYHMTNPDFWNSFKSKKVLIFQTDSAILQNNILKFMEYDYVGAPWLYNPCNVDDIHIGNGGLSLRNPVICAEICKKYTIPRGFPEDVFFSKNFYYCEHANLPNFNEAMEFSAETIPSIGTFGMHKVYGYNQKYVVNKIFNVSTKKNKSPKILEAKIICDNDIIYSNDNLIKWLNLGIGNDGLFIPKNTIIPYDTNYGLYAGSKKILYIKFFSEITKKLNETFVLLIKNKKVQFDYLIN